MRWTLAWVLVGLSCAPAASAPEPSVAATSTPDPSARSPGAASQPGENRELALELAEGLVAACASAPQLAAAAARKRCADGLSALAVLRERASEPLLWGAQRAGTGYDIAASQTTQMNALVLRRMYLSTFEFGPEFHLVEDGGQLILRVAVRFRDDLDPGDYPYPFWHSADKWRSYESAREVLFFIEEGALRAVLRSFEREPARPHVERPWDGRWTWQSSRGAEPRNALFSALLSANNPHIEALDAAYRAFESEQRGAACLSCHDPSNRAQANPLELFSYPNQALTGRHDIVREVSQGSMPPASSEMAPGVTDPLERQRLIEAAGHFADLGDAALRFEGERVR